MFTTIKVTILTNARRADFWIWCLAFPIILATLFIFMFGSLKNSDTVMSVPVAVVKDASWEGSGFSQVVGALSGEVVVAQSHHDVVVRLPEGAVELARTARYGNQAFRLGSSWGVQFHPEATPELIEDWSRRSPRRAEVVAEVTAAMDAITASGRAVTQAFAQVVRG